MIFISLGTQKFEFNRLLKYIDELIEEGNIKEPVFAQTGNSTYQPKNYEYQQFLTQQEFEQKIETCDVFLTHGGVGAITTAMNYKKKIIVCPRLAKFGEHVDDHQLEISSKYKELGIIHLAKDREELLLEIMNIGEEKNNVTELKSSTNEIIHKIMSFIERESNDEN